jgi:hypothetical protein
MERRGDEIHTDTTEASAGSRENVVRWVLLVGLVLAIGLLTIIWVTGALSHPEGTGEGNVSTATADQSGDGTGTDSIVTPQEPTTAASQVATETPLETVKN